MWNLFRGLAADALKPDGLKRVLGVIAGPGGFGKGFRAYGTNTILGLGLPLAITAFSHDTPQNKLKRAVTDVGMFGLAMGIKNPIRQGLFLTALQMSHMMPSIARAAVQGFKGYQNSLTAAAIPFSHSSLNMDQAYGALQYASSRVRDSYTSFSGVGNEAAMFHAKYMNRG